MAITPDYSVPYCSGTSGAIIEYQTPERGIGQANWEWSQIAVSSSQLPVQLLYNVALGDLIETVYLDVSVSPSIAMVETLTLNDYYTFVVSGTINLDGGTTIADACYEIIVGVSESVSNRLTIDDIDYPNLFNGTAPYDGVTHAYSIGYIGDNNIPVFTFSGGITGTLTIDIYRNDYTLNAFYIPYDTPINIFLETRHKPYETINLSCGGQCPNRTSFQCTCADTTYCYWDDQDGAITNIFEGSPTI